MPQRYGQVNSFTTGFVRTSYMAITPSPPPDKRLHVGERYPKFCFVTFINTYYTIESLILYYKYTLKKNIGLYFECDSFQSMGYIL